MKSSYDYRAAARESLQGRWSDAALTMVVYVFIVVVCCGVSSVGVLPAFSGIHWLQGVAGGLTGVLSILVVAPMEFAMYIAFLEQKRGSECSSFHDAFDNFCSRYVSVLTTSFLMVVIVTVASAFTLGILGVILAYAYRMTPYLLRDYPSLTAREALETSRRMMKGHKWDLFMLDLSFIGWALLTILTAGIGVLWLGPYMYTASAHFYEDLKFERLEEN